MEMSKQLMPTTPNSDNGSCEVYKFVDSSRAVTLLKGFATLYEEKEFTDVTLSVGGHEFQCHKNVLAISSPYFMAMFHSDLVESQKSHVKLREMNYKTVSMILEYIYTGQVSMTEDSVQDLLSASNLFQLLSLRTGCADFMIKQVNISNSIGIYFFAKAHQCERLAQKAKDIINSSFSTLCREQEFLQLPCEKLVEMIRDDDLSVETEHLVYEACHSWINYSLHERRRYLTEVMKHVRFAIMNCYYFCDNIDNNSLFLGNRSLLEIVDRVKYYHMLRNRVAEIDLNFMPRKGMKSLRGVVIMANPHSEEGSCRKFNAMEILMPKTGKIRHMCKLPQSIYMPASCITGENHIYLAGGAIRKNYYRGPYTAEGVSSNLFLYDRNFGSWQVKNKMHSGRSQFSLSIVDNGLYAVGGQSESEALASVEKYDLCGNNWEHMAALPKTLRCHSAIAYKGKLYVFGGESEGVIVNTAYRYDPAENSWLELPTMSTARALAGIAVYREKIYLIGGNTSVSTKWKKELLPEHCTPTSEVYDPTASSWSDGPELPNALCGAGVVKYGNTLIVVGGEDDKSWMAGTFVLSKDENGREVWSEGHELPHVMSTFTCVVANIPPNLISSRDER